MESVKLGLIGLGMMGSQHLRLAASCPGLALAAVCARTPAAVRRAAAASGAEGFTDYRRLIAAGGCEAVLVATPHPSHAAIGAAALRAGLHVLMEKPLAVHKLEAERLLAVPRRPGQVFAVMLNQRTDPLYRKIKELVAGGELGRVQRVSWVVTDWFRTEGYYRSAPWRGSWAGEGGGVLVNQCPHQLDLLQWLFGQPLRVAAWCRLGAWHRIEVEDEATAFLELPGGATATFIASTGEFPGTNRLEVAADRGRLVAEGGRLEFLRTETSVAACRRGRREPWGRPGLWRVEVPAAGPGGQHAAVLADFAAAVRAGRAPLVPAEEGLHHVELANAMLLSSLTGRPVPLPLDGRAFARRLAGLVRGSGRGGRE